MNNFTKIIGVLIATFICSYSAYAVCLPNTTPTTTLPIIVYSNGMFNTYQQARDSLRALQLELKVWQPTLQLEYRLAYADDNGANIGTVPGVISGLGQLLEVYIQKNGDTTSYFWRLLGSVDVAPVWFQQTMNDLAAQTNLGTYVQDIDLQRQLNDIYRPFLNEGRKIIIVSHSQGNLYANAAYDALTLGSAGGNASWASSIGNVAVATPASIVAAGGPYVTAVEDLVIDAIHIGAVAAARKGIVITPPLPPNASNLGDGTSGDSMGHNFIKHYLAGNTTRPRILNHIVNLVQSLQSPVQQYQSGEITVTMLWANATDMDLHIYEPTSHVYYANMQGVAGYIDVDNTTGYGPEHYFASCNTLVSGMYRVAANYYSGTARPETVVFRIKAGTITKTFTQTFGLPFGASGDNRPLPVANIFVTFNPNGGFDYFIQ